MEYRYKPTTHGLAAMAAYMDLEKPFHLTRVAFGSGKVDKDTNLADVHELLEYVSDGAVADRNHKDNRFNLTIQYANSEHKEVKTFLLSEFIVYVEDPETGNETDLIYGTMGDYRQPVPAYNPAYPPSIFNFPLVMVLSDEVHVIVSAPAGLPTYDDLENVVKRHNEDPDAHADLLKQFAKTGDPGEPGSAVLLDETGKIRVSYLPDVILKRNGVLTDIITIPASAWQEDPDGPCAYRADVSCEKATEAHIPYVSPDNSSMGTAESCGLYDKAEAADGVLRFWADSVPEADIIARAALLGPGGGTYAAASLPIATAGSLGCIKPGDGLKVLPDGTLSVDTASQEEVNEMLTGVFGPDNK